MAHRGHWDRAASHEERALAHRRAITDAVASATFELGRAVTVSDVVERAGIGRNTFYVEFRDLAAAFAAAEAEALAFVSLAFAPARDTRTPIERLRRMALEWLSRAETQPKLVSLLIRGDGRPRGAHARLGQLIGSSLEGVATSARAAGLVGRPVDAARLRGVVGAFVAFAEQIITERANVDSGGLADELVDFTLRAFR